MGIFRSHSSLKASSVTSRKSSVPSSSTSSGPSLNYLLPEDPSGKSQERCHCVADVLLENRYNLLRAEEHARFEGKCGPLWSREVSERPENADRNRYASVRPWDHSRVILPIEDNENDYIDASWIQLGSRVYIAAQGPLPSTVGDFWHMVYAYGGEPSLIVMLTPLYEHSIEKCSKYWPDSKNEPRVIHAERGFHFGFDIHLVGSKEYENYTWSTLRIVPSDASRPSRTVNHVYYHSWLDYSKPNANSDLHSLIHFLNNDLRNPGAPPIVHCSAGIGRTGTFIATDALMAKVDISIEPCYGPENGPVWRCPPSQFAYRPTLFSIHKDTHRGSSGNGSPNTINMLSKYDLSSTKSLKSQSVVSVNSNDNNNEAGDIPTDKRPVPKRSAVRKSALSEAIKRSEPDTQPLQELVEDQESCDCDVPSQSKARKATNTEPSTESGVEEKTKLEANEGSSAQPSGVSALRGPPIKHIKARTVEVAPEELRETPETIDVNKWFDPSDPVMSCVRCMRKQRPKMVQGKEQLGYIYDQFEVSLQLSRVSIDNNNGSKSGAASFKTAVAESGPQSVSSNNSEISSRSQSKKQGLKNFLFHGSFSSVRSTHRRGSIVSNR